MFRKPDPAGIFMLPLEVKEHPHKGYICVAASDIQPHSLIERCPTIKFEISSLIKLHEYLLGRSIFHDYVFTDKGYAYFAMGYGGIYSHADEPNARWSIKYDESARETIEIRAMKPISKGDEITIKYTYNPKMLWFEQENSSE